MLEDHTFSKLCEIRHEAAELIRSNPSKQYYRKIKDYYRGMQFILRELKIPNGYNLELYQGTAEKDPYEKNPYTSVGSEIIAGFVLPRLATSILEGQSCHDPIWVATAFDTRLGVMLALADINHASRYSARAATIDDIIRENAALARYLAFIHQSDSRLTTELIDRILRDLSGDKAMTLIRQQPEDITLTEARILGHVRLLELDPTGLQMIGQIASERLDHTNPFYTESPGFPLEILSCRNLGVKFTTDSYRRIVTQIQKTQGKEIKVLPPRSILERLRLRVPKMV